MSQSQQIDEAEKLQLVIRNCVQKAAELILHARLKPMPPAMRRGASNRWVRCRAVPARHPPATCARAHTGALLPWQFNIDSEELLSLREELSGWRQQVSQPLRLDIFVDTGDSALLREAVGAQAHERGTVLLERWWLRYEPPAAQPRGIGWPGFYKRFMVLLRALIGFLSLMPAHRLAASLAKLRGTDALRGSAALLGYRIAVRRLSDHPAPPSPPARPRPHRHPRRAQVAPTLDGQEPAFPASPPPKQYTFAPPDLSHGAARKSEPNPQPPGPEPAAGDRHLAPRRRQTPPLRRIPLPQPLLPPAVWRRRGGPRPPQLRHLARRPPHPGLRHSIASHSIASHSIA
jgi:hypothetical protein